MNPKSLILLATAAFLLTSCGANKAVIDDKQQTSRPSADKKTDLANNEVVGEWEMVGFVIDTNDNLQIDEAERKDLKPTMKDYMKLNRDGSGEFTLARLQGRYEINDPESNGRKYLTWHDKANGRHRIGTIIKATKDELHIKEPGGHGLFVWKRL